MSEQVIEKTNGNGQHAVEPAPARDLSFMERMIASAIDRGGEVETLKGLLAARNGEIDREREIAFNQAFVRMRNKIPVIKGTEKAGGTTRRGADFQYGYADLAKDIDPIIQPIMKEDGFAFTFLPIEQTTDYVVVEGRLIYERNGWMITARKREYIDKEASMGLNQKGGAAQTYAIRYLTVAMLSLRILGEDTDGKGRSVERGPAKSPPPSQKSHENAWAKEREKALAGEEWWRTAMETFAAAETSENLEAFVDLIRNEVGKESEQVQNEMGTALQKARLRLSRAKETHAATSHFDHPVHDAQGETDGEIFTDHKAWASEFMNYWAAAKNADDRENLIHHNTDALAQAMQAGASHQLAEVKRWMDDVASGQQTTEDPEFPFEAWVETQREVLPRQPILDRQITIREIAARCNGREIVPPAWLREMILPVKAAGSHQEWAEARLADLEFIADKPAFLEAVKAAKPRMAIIKKDDPKLWDRVNAAFTAKQAEIKE